MDSYPKELLEGVSPLIFAVDTVLNKQQQQQQQHNQHNQQTDQHNRRSTVFELFYNSIASKKSIDACFPTSATDATAAASSDTSTSTSTPNANTNTITNTSPTRQIRKSISKSTFRFPKLTSSSKQSKHHNDFSTTKKDFFSNAHIVPVSNRHAFPPSKDPHGNQNQNIALNTKLYKSISTSLLGGGGGGSSSNNGSGSGSSSSSSKMNKKRNVYNILKVNPIQGILPSGWIEKHVHALPSTLLFITELELDPTKSSDTTNNGTGSAGSGDNNTTPSKSKSNANSTLYDQALLEQHLLHTIDNIQSTMAKKRDVPIHLVVLVKMENEYELNNPQHSTSNTLSSSLPSSSSSTSASASTPSSPMATSKKMDMSSGLGLGLSSSLGLTSSSPAAGGVDHGDKMILLQERINSIKTVLRLNSNNITTLQYTTTTTTATTTTTTTTDSGGDNETPDTTTDKKDDTTASTTTTPPPPPTSTTTTTTPAIQIKYNMKQLSKLQQIIYENSNLYYLTQVRRFKRKYALLHHDKIFDILPFAIRYCIKIAIFYEFQCRGLVTTASSGDGTGTNGGISSSSSNSNSTEQGSGNNSNSNKTSRYKEVEEEKLKREKSIKYWKEAYTNIITYYTYLMEMEMESRGNDELYYYDKNNKMSNRNSIQSVALTESYRKSQVKRSSISDGVSVGVSVGVGNDDKDGTQRLLNNDKERPNLLPPPPPPPPPPADSTPIQNGVEVALVYSPESGNGGIAIGANSPIKATPTKTNDADDDMNSMTHYEDMIHQCRAVADWLNVKLLLLTSSTSSTTTITNMKTTNDVKSNMEEIISLSNQVRKHKQVFLSRPMTLTAYSTMNHSLMKQDENHIRRMDDPSWYFWQYVANQNQVLSEFMEQHINIPSTILSRSMKFDISCQFDAARHHMSTGQSLLKLGLAVRRELDQQQEVVSNGGTLIKRNNGDTGSGDNRQRFVGSLAGFELSTIFDEESVRDHSGLALDSLKHALTLLEKKNQLSSGESKRGNDTSYARLYYLIGGILMKDEKFEDAIEPLQNALSYSTGFSSIHVLLEKALIQCYKKISTTDSIDINQKLIDSSLSLIFNTGTNAAISKATLASLTEDIFSLQNKANSTRVFDWPYGSDEEQPFQFALTFPDRLYAIEGDEVNAIVRLRSNLRTPLRVKDVLIEPNFGAIKIEPHNEVDRILMLNESIQFDVKVTIPSDFSKSVDSALFVRQAPKVERPTTAGLTKIGGGVYLKKKEEKKKMMKGGLCVGCTAAFVKVSLPNDSTSAMTVKIHNTHRGSAPPPQKTSAYMSTEKDDYIYSSWSRPSSFPMSLGPRCLRVLSPQPNLEIRDLTTTATKGRLMEGTVNRIMLEIKAIPTEHCRNMRISVLCNSLIEQNSSKSMTLLDKEESDTNPVQPSRLPVLVQHNGDDNNDSKNLPVGWTSNNKNNGQGSMDDWRPVVDILSGGSSTYASFDLFRPLSEYEEKDKGRCKTNFFVTISYKQVRPNQCKASRDGDLVMQEYKGSAIWCSPIKAAVSFLPVTKKALPSGIRHVGNTIANTSSVNDSTAIVSGGKAFMRCTLEASEARNNLAVVLQNAKFEPNVEQEESKCDVELVPSGENMSEQSDLLFSPKSNELCRDLNVGKKINIVFAVQPTIKHDTDHFEESVATRLGAISVNWSPVPLRLPDEMHFENEDNYRGSHGPLSIKELRSVKQKGPLCHVEITPFETSFETVPQMPTVGNPFEVRYVISNQTNFHQRLRVLMNDSDTIASSNSMLVSGIINGEIILGPFEKKLLSYSLLVTKVGNITLPAFDVSSVRYNTWVIHSSSMDRVFISP